MQSDSLSSRDKKVIWHPYTQAQLASDAIAIVKGEGVYLIDDKGNRYIDAVGSWWVNSHGHSHPVLAEAVYEQAKKLEHVIFAGFTHEPAVALAEALLDFAGNAFSKVFYSDNGSTAVEVAIKMALQYFDNKQEKRNKIIAYKNAYHGDTFGAMSVSARSIFTAAFEQQLFEVIFIDAPTRGNEAKSIEQLKEILQNEETVAFIFEPLIQGAGGMITYSAEVLNEQIALCKEYKVLTIADEVFTGFYRTGTAFAILQLQNKPDIICLSKALTGGMMPLGVTMAAEFIFEAFLSNDRSKTFFHGHSFTGNPLACAVALASLKIFQNENYLLYIQSLYEMQKSFVEQMQKHPNVKDARSCGIIAVLEFETNETSGYLNAALGDAFNFFLEKGILIRPLGNIIYTVPPYTITTTELTLVHESFAAFADYLTEKQYGKTNIETSENFD